MPELPEDLRVTNETVESIMARRLADTNAGIDPNDPAYADTVPGSFWDDLNRAGGLEEDRIYDRMNEVVAMAIPSTSTGGFLDAWAQSLGMERTDAAFAGGTLEFTGPEGTVISAGTQASTPQTSQDSEPVAFQTIEGGTIGVLGVLELDVIARTAGAHGNVPANTVLLLDTQIPAVTVTNPVAMTGGADIQTDERLQLRIIRKLSGAGGGGNDDDYVDWALGWPGVGFVTVKANTPSPGHATILITDLNNDPMPSFAVDGLQADLDPSGSTSQGRGRAPIGATVHVAAPASLPVAPVATVALEPGFTLDGAGGTQAVRAAIEASVGRYINFLPVGGDVVRNKVIAAIVSVHGVIDVTALTLNAGTGDVAVAADKVASMTSPISLTAA